MKTEKKGQVIGLLIGAEVAYMIWRFNSPGGILFIFGRFYLPALDPQGSLNKQKKAPGKSRGFCIARMGWFLVDSLRLVGDYGKGAHKGRARQVFVNVMSFPRSADYAD